MFYKYESDFDNDLMFWSNCTADLWHDGESFQARRSVMGAGLSTDEGRVGKRAV